MKKELEEKLRADFPKLYRDLYGSPQVTCMAFGIETSDGWYDLIYDLSHKINIEINKLPEPERNDCYFAQIKEKFGKLRVYMTGNNDGIDRLINEAERKSQTICEFCGKEGSLRRDLGWLLTLCDEHYLARKK